MANHLKQKKQATENTEITEKYMQEMQLSSSVQNYAAYLE